MKFTADCYDKSDAIYINLGVGGRPEALTWKGEVYDYDGVFSTKGPKWCEACQEHHSNTTFHLYLLHAHYKRNPSDRNSIRICQDKVGEYDHVLELQLAYKKGE